MKDITDPPAAVAQTEASLADLAKQITSAHTDALAAARTSLEHARKAGQLLLQAKARLAHGKFMGWVEANCPFSQRTANGYMRVADRWEDLLARGPGGNPAGVREALEVLAEPAESNWQPVANLKGRGESGCPCRCLARRDRENRREMSQKWWDLFAGYVVILDAAEWQDDEIAVYMGMPVEDVRRVLNPEPPRRFTSELNDVPLDDPEGRPLLVTFYENSVSRWIALVMGHIYRSAAYRAEHEGPAELAPRMMLMAEECDKRARRHYERSVETGFGERFASRDLSALFACILSDARAALGIEGAERFLIRAWMTFRDLLPGEDEDESAAGSLEDSSLLPG
jgi:hypothetical protein